MKISAVIPHVPIDESYNDMLRRCTDSLVGVDEVIIVVNEMTGFAKNVNQGLKVASGDFLCIVNNDIELINGSVVDLVDTNTVTYPTVNGDDQNPGCLMCIPRNIYKSIGGLDEGFQYAYFEDDDFIRRLEINNIPLVHIPEVEVSHKGGTTIESLPGRDVVFSASQAYYERKWGIK